MSKWEKPNLGTVSMGHDAPMWPLVVLAVAMGVLFGVMVAYSTGWIR